MFYPIQNRWTFCIYCPVTCSRTFQVTSERSSTTACINPDPTCCPNSKQARHLSPIVPITNHKTSISEPSNSLRQRLLLVLKGKAWNGVVGTLGDVILMMTTATSPQLIKADMMDPCGYIYDDSGSWATLVSLGCSVQPLRLYVARTPRKFEEPHICPNIVWD